MESPQMPQSAPGPNLSKILIPLVILLVLFFGYGTLAKSYNWWPHEVTASPSDSPKPNGSQWEGTIDCVPSNVGNSACREGLRTSSGNYYILLANTGHADESFLGLHDKFQKSVSVSGTLMSKDEIGFSEYYRDYDIAGILSANSIVDITGWQTYRNNDMDFEIKLPPDWDVTNGAEVGITIHGPGHGAMPMINIYTDLRTPEESLQQDTHDLTVETSRVTVAGEQALKAVDPNKYEYSIYLYIPHQGQTFVIQTLFGRESVEEILSTFKFTN